MARLGVGDVAHLRVGDMQQLGKLHPVGGRLVEQQQKFGVRQHEPRRLGFQTFLHVLCGRRHNSGVLPKAFPRPVQKLPGIVVFEVQVYFIQEYPGVFAPLAVLHDTVLNPCLFE